mgnify:FL=1
MKLAKANKVARKRLKLANQYMNTGKSKEFYEEIVNALWGYLSDKLSIPTSQLLRDNILQELTIFGANEQLCHDVIDILDICDMALYSPQLSDKEISKIYNKTMTIINDIEAIKRQK